ncbi:hypothetical protein [Metapseudomonas furukawaii]|uniref:hypothetical protein n=1 Tax=Metapseudomonas furukawaii TaxID=1149133 RepID=UPI001313E585|nr:hypothetical protein [Pseudomonas furukawaii]
MMSITTQRHAEQKLWAAEAMGEEAELDRQEAAAVGAFQEHALSVSEARVVQKEP